jgi:hypothetical protein
MPGGWSSLLCMHAPYALGVSCVGLPQVNAAGNSVITNNPTNPLPASSTPTDSSEGPATPAPEPGIVIDNPDIPAATNNAAGTDDTLIPSTDDSYFPTWGMSPPATSPAASPQSAVSPSPASIPPAASPSPQPRPAEVDTASTTNASNSGNLPAGNNSSDDQPQPRDTGAPQPTELPVQAGNNGITNNPTANTTAVNQPAAASDVPSNQPNADDNSPVLDLPLDEPGFNNTAPPNTADSEPQVDILTPDDATNQSASGPSNQTPEDIPSPDLPAASPEPEPATSSNSNNLPASPSVNQVEEPAPLPTNGTNSTLDAEAVVLPPPGEQNTTVPTNSTTVTAPEADVANSSSPAPLQSPNVSVATNQGTDTIPVPPSDSFTFQNQAASPGPSSPIPGDSRNEVMIPTTDLPDDGATGSPSPTPVPSPSPVSTPVNGRFAAAAHHTSMHATAACSDQHPAHKSCSSPHTFCPPLPPLLLCPTGCIPDYISTYAGYGKQAFIGDDSPATSAGLLYPTGITLGASQSLYIADSGQHRWVVLSRS